MAFSITSVIRTRPNKNNAFNVYLRLTIHARNGESKKVAYQATGLTTEKRSWDKNKGRFKQSYILASKMNAYLSRREEEVRLQCIEPFALNLPAAVILDNSLPRNHTFLEFIDQYIEIRKNKKQYVTANIYMDHKSYIERYDAKADIYNIDEKWIDGLVRSMQETCNSQTIKRKLTFFSGCYKLALKQKVVTYNPFDDYKFVAKSKKLKKIAPQTKVKELVELEPSLPPKQRLAVQILLTQYFTRGTRISDILLLEKKQREETHIVFYELKSKAYKKVKIHNAIRPFLLYYDDPRYVFPVISYNAKVYSSEEGAALALHDELKRCTARINSALRKVSRKIKLNFNLTTHVARHSFATHGIDALNGDMRAVQKLLAHKSYKTTEGYLQDLERSNYDDLQEKAYKIK